MSRPWVHGYSDGQTTKLSRRAIRYVHSRVRHGLPCPASCQLSSDTPLVAASLALSVALRNRPEKLERNDISRTTTSSRPGAKPVSNRSALVPVTSTSPTGVDAHR